jgi:hypothetical protein
VANGDLLNREGFRAVARHEIVKQKSMEELILRIVVSNLMKILVLILKMTNLGVPGKTLMFL